MPFPISVTFQGMLPSVALSTQIEQQAEHLRRLVPGLLVCRVAVRRKEDRYRKHCLYMVHASVTLRLRDGYIGGASNTHEDVNVAIRATFEILQQQVELFMSQRRDDPSVIATGRALP